MCTTIKRAQLRSKLKKWMKGNYLCFFYFYLLLGLLLLSPTWAFADEGEPKKWWSTPLIIIIYLGFFLLAMCLALCMRIYHDRRSLFLNHHSDEDDIEEVRGLDAEEIESLPSLRFSELKMQWLKEVRQQLECAVCLSEFRDQEVVSILPNCFHVFHPPCITSWLASQVTCPICRSNLEHRNGLSVGMSSISDGTSPPPISKRFDHSGNYRHYDDNQIRDRVIVEIGGSSGSEMINIFDGPSVTGDITKLHRSYSSGDLLRENSIMIRSTSWCSLLPKESISKSDYWTVTVNNAIDRSCISPKSDSSVDYSSLLLSKEISQLAK